MHTHLQCTCTLYMYMYICMHLYSHCEIGVMDLLCDGTIIQYFDEFVNGIMLLCLQLANVCTS